MTTEGMRYMTTEERALLYEALEAIYFDTVAPLARALKEANVDLLDTEWPGTAESYWEQQSDYGDMMTQR